MIDDDAHESCESCGDCLTCDPEHACKFCGRCDWRCMVAKTCKWSDDYREQNEGN